MSETPDRRKIRVLIVEDMVEDAQLVLRELRRSGFDAEWNRVDTKDEYLAQLNGSLDIILSDYHMPQFEAPMALQLLQESGLDIPFIIVSGAIGEETAVAAMKQGANDYLLKDRLARLGPAVVHALAEKHLREERKRALRALRASEEQLRLITDHASVFLAQLDSEHRYKFVNRPYADRYDREPRDIIGAHVADVIGSAAYDLSRHRMEAALNGQRVEFEMVIPNSGPSPRWEHVVYVPEHTQTGEVVGLVAIITDITSRKHVEQELERRRDEALAAARAKDDFLAALSHELRTPLSPVLLLASEAALNPDLAQAVRADFETIRKNVELEARLIDDLLDITSIARGKLPLDRRAVNLHVVLRDVMATVQPEIERKRISLTVDFGAPRPQIWGDAVRLQQVFWNLLKNAVKFTPEEGRIVVSTKSENESVLAQITDTGIGMTSDELGRVFEAFSQGEHAADGSSHRFGGLGLGLAISRKLVELHSGRVHAASPGRDQGSVFTVELPLLSPSEAERLATPGEGTNVEPVESPKGLRILLVEDHEPTRTALEHLLARRRFVVKPAGSLAEARELVDQHDFDLVISDIGLPDGNGCELMSELRTRKGLKGIALTGYGMEEDISQSHEAGFSTHLTKPVRMQTLERALAATLGGQ